LIYQSIDYAARGRNILKDASLAIEPGSICGLFGGNGSGETTLIKLGAGMLSPDSGSVTIDGVSLPENVGGRYKRLAHLDQETFLPGSMRVDRLVDAVGARPYAVKHYPSQLMPQYVDTLSGGERRLLEVVIVLSLGRDFVLLDEPFTGVEPLLIEEMISMISAERAAGKGILVTDQYHFHVTDIVDSAFLLTDGHCDELDVSGDLGGELRNRGYLPEA